MKTNSLLPILLALGLVGAVPAGLGAQTGDLRIQIAIPDLQPLGSMAPEEISAVTDLIMTAIANIPIFDVLERKQSAELYQEIAVQLQSGMIMDEAVRNSQLRGAGALLLGSYGKLYGKVILTTRLVDLQTGRILFANSIYTTQEALAGAISELAGAIQEKGRELNTPVSLKNIEAQVNSRNWTEAKRLIDIYLRTKAADESVRTLFDRITVGLAEDYFNQAKKYVGQGLFDEARQRIAEAIALKPDARFYGYREQISREEQDWVYRRKLEDARRQAALSSGKPDFDLGDSIVQWFSGLTVDGARLGASYGLDLDTAKLSLGLGGSDWGLELAWQRSNLPQGGKGLLNWCGYLGTALRYEAVPGGARSVLAQVYLSPFVAESFKLGNVALTLGLDGGGLLWYGPVSSDGYLLGASFGLAGALDFKLSGSFGLFAMTKVDWRWYPEAPGSSGPAIRAVAGLVF